MKIIQRIKKGSNTGEFVETMLDKVSSRSELDEVSVRWDQVETLVEEDKQAKAKKFFADEKDDDSSLISNILRESKVDKKNRESKKKW